MPPQTFQVPFPAHVELLHFFLSQRDQIAERIQGLLSAQRKPIEYRRDASLLSPDFEDCFFTLPGISQAHSTLRGQLEAAHWASGFKPRQLPGLHNGLIDPAEMMIRAFHLWQQTRWPGRNGRVRYAHTLFNLYVLRCLELLSMRLWDPGPSTAGERLAQVQGLLDQLWQTSPADQPPLVRDARWLIPLAQSPATDDLGPYFSVAERIAESLSGDDRLEVHAAGVRLAAGHLRSQIRHYATKKGVRLDDDNLILDTRNTNALDFALLIQDLVPLLEAYERAAQRGDSTARLELAGTICQGLSPDPELFLNRVELLRAYSMIEHLFVTTNDEERAVYTPIGRRHVALCHAYEELITLVSKPLADDCPHFRPVPGAYSPYGALYGFASDLLEHMALKTSLPDAVPRFGLEDVFTHGDDGAAKLAWVSGWRKLPHLSPEVLRQFEYPQPFAEEVFDRLEQALRRRAANVAVRTGRFVIVPGDDRQGDSAACVTSDDEAQLLSDRREGRCLLSYKAPGGWVAISKRILTEVLGVGRDVTLSGLPPVAAGTLTLMCAGLVTLPDGDPGNAEEG